MAVETGTPTEVETRGLVDALDRILRQLISTPKFKETVITLLNAMDPPAARRLVRTIFWQDPGLLMSVLGTLPAFLNTAFQALAEVAAQMNSMPSPLLQDLLHRIVEDLDGAALGEAMGGLVKMGLSLGLSEEESGLRRSLSSLRGDFSASFATALGEVSLEDRVSAWMAKAAERARDKDSATHAFIQAFRGALKENPDFVKHVIKPLLEMPAKPAAKKAASKSGGTKSAAKKTDTGTKTAGGKTGGARES
ncbi:hypothetical protein [Candidatus Solincola sp.]|jgi:hypothetical protein|nr:hypothetical protein [Actinomycetota bacterium]